jgi:hypothetical protein
MFSDSITCYEAIASALSKAAPEKWSSINVEVTLDGVRVDVVISYQPSSNGAIGYITGVPRLASHFWELARLVSTEEKGLFKNCVFKLEHNGKYDAQFTY